jgi:hypothetical protein
MIFAPLLYLSLDMALPIIARLLASVLDAVKITVAPFAIRELHIASLAEFMIFSASKPKAWSDEGFP